MLKIFAKRFGITLLVGLVVAALVCAIKGDWADYPYHVGFAAWGAAVTLQWPWRDRATQHTMWCACDICWQTGRKRQEEDA